MRLEKSLTLSREMHIGIDGPVEVFSIDVIQFFLNVGAQCIADIDLFALNAQLHDISSISIDVSVENKIEQNPCGARVFT
jgi:hypothetical protein